MRVKCLYRKHGVDAPLMGARNRHAPGAVRGLLPIERPPVEIPYRAIARYRNSQPVDGEIDCRGQRNPPLTAPSGNDAEQNADQMTGCEVEPANDAEQTTAGNKFSASKKTNDGRGIKPRMDERRQDHTREHDLHATEAPAAEIGQ